MSKPRAYSYIRMSSEAQLAGDSLRRQLEASENYATQNGLDLTGDFDLQDLGISAFTGENSSSGALSRFLSAVRSGKIEQGSYLLVESLDRISRQQPRLALTQFLELINSGIVLVTISDQRKYTKETASLEDLLVSLVIMSRAHEESVTKSLRISAAWANKRRKSQDTKLTARCPAWLRLSADRTTFEVDAQREQIIKRIFSDALAGMGSYSIARRLNADGVQAFVGRHGWHTSSVSKIICNRSVIGEFQPHRLVQGKRVTDGNPIQNYYPRLIDDSTFNAVQAHRIQKRTSGGGRRGTRISNLFSKLATCQYCGGPMRFENKGAGPKGGSYLACDSSARRKGCSTTRWKYDDFEASFLAFVEEVDLGSILTSESDAENRAKLEQEAKSLEGQILQATIERDNIFKLLEHEGIDVSSVGQRLVLCESKLAKLKNASRDIQQTIIQSVAQAGSYYESKDILSNMISELANKGAEDVYRIRAQISTRLRNVVSHLAVAAEGRAPLKGRIVSEVDIIAKDEDAIFREKLKKVIGQGSGANDGRYFAVTFRDGSYRIVFPTNEDPLTYSHQMIPSGTLVAP